jgi:pre-mRNA branch site protein p14
VGHNAQKKVQHAHASVAVWDLFGKYGPIRQIRTGNSSKTRGTAFVVYEELGDVRFLVPKPQGLKRGIQAKVAFEHLNGFHLQERYLVGQCRSLSMFQS